MPVTFSSKLLAGATALSLLASPAAALDLPNRADSAPTVGAAQDVSEHRSHRRHRHRDGIDAGDILTGILIIGGIAVLADAAKGDDEYRRRDRERDPYRYRNYDDRGDYDDRDDRDDRVRDAGFDARFDARELERAAGRCMDAAEDRGLLVETVDSARREDRGWDISGEARDGTRWTCGVDDAGRVYRVDRVSDAMPDVEPASDAADYRDERDGGWSAADDRQYPDDVYTSARNARGGEPYAPPDRTWNPDPAPLPLPAPEPRRDGGDGRYDTGRVGDFEQDGYGPRE